MARVVRENEVETVEPAGTLTAARIVQLVVGVVETLLGLRVVLKLLGANPNAGFVDFVYALTNPLVAPFRGIFRTPTLEGNVTTASFDWAAIVAMIVYALLGWVIIRALTLGSRRVVS